MAVVTLREHLCEAISHLETHHRERGEAWGTQAALLNAVAALAILDQAEYWNLVSRGGRFVPDDPPVPS